MTPLGDRDEAFMERLLRQAERWLLPWHDAQVRGVEHVPPGPVLYVGNHNGATYSGDTWILAVHLWHHGGLDALPHGLAHDLILKVPVLGDTLRRVGVVPAHPDAALALLRAGRKVMVYPGGDFEALRPWSERNVVKFSGRRGFVRTALLAGVPIVPVAAQGAHETLIVIDDLPGLARAIGAARFLRMKVWPLAFTVPWGFTLGPTPPYIPLPARMRIEILPPVRFDRMGPEAATDESYVSACASTIEDLIQAAVFRMAASKRAEAGDAPGAGGTSRKST